MLIKVAMSIQAAAASLFEHGYCVIENVIPPDRCEHLREVYFSVYAERKKEIEISKNVGLIQGGINHAPEIADYLVDERVISVCERVLRSPVRTSFTTAIINDAGADEGPLHADWPFDHTHAAHVRSPYSSDLCLHITSLWSLSPPDDKLGGTSVVPGSHRSSTNPTAADWREDMRSSFGPSETILGELGSVLLLDSRVWHARAPNVSSQPRILFATGYVPWWLNVDVLRPGAPVFPGLEAGGDKKDYRVPLIRRETIAALSPRTRQFFAHWVEST